MNKIKPTLFITMGLPASGKTFFSQRIAADITAFYLNVDALRMSMIPHPTFEVREHKMVFRTAHFIVEQHLLQGQSIVCNANYHVRAHRDELKNLAKHCNAHFQIIWVDVPYEIAQKRIIDREHEIPAAKMNADPLDILKRMKRHFQEPTAEEPVIKIDGTLPYTEQRAVFIRELQR